ncbi:hypothetical protein, partial [Agrococcus sp. HG114]|uniref:hypothetical protein n=1 Tax=Agrococcus sp. HG114 TaxID=2969757 RepID=UPI00215A5DAE
TPAPPAPAAPSAPGATAVPAPSLPGQPDAAPREPAALPTTRAPLGEAVDFDTGVTVDVLSVEPITVAAQTPGEVSGPALRVVVEARNGSGEPQQVGSAVVTLVADGGEPGVDTTAGDPSPLTGTLPPGSTATGTYVFMLDPAAGREVTITVNYAAGEPLAVFTGETS